MTSSSSSLSFRQIMDEMKRVKVAAAVEEKRLKQSQSRSQMSSPHGDRRPSPGAHNRTIKGRPRSPPPIGSFKWDRTAELGPTLSKDLYRASSGDTSGTTIRFVARDEGGEMAGKWLPGLHCQTYLGTLPPTPSVMCSKRFQSSLMEHTAKTVEKVELLYAAMPEYTTRLRNAKAKVGADLSNLQWTRSRILDALQAPIETNDTSHIRSIRSPHSPSLSRTLSRPLSSPSRWGEYQKGNSPEVFHHIVTRPPSSPSSSRLDLQQSR